MQHDNMRAGIALMPVSAADRGHDLKGAVVNAVGATNDVSWHLVWGNRMGRGMRQSWHAAIELSVVQHTK